MKRLFLGSLFIIIASTSSLAQNTGSTKADFLKLARYLSANSGQWTSPNPNYDADKEFSAKAFGLWFKSTLRSNLLHLTHVVYRGDTAQVTGESYWIWHPGEQKIKYYSINKRGAFTNGETYFTSDDKFVTIEYTYSPNGVIQKRKDQNFIKTDKEHATISSVFKGGIWQKEAEYTFTKSEKKN